MPNQHSSASDFIRQLVIPVLNPIRRHLPVPAGLDFSPLIAIILIQSFSLLINENITAKNSAQWNCLYQFSTSDLKSIDDH